MFINLRFNIIFLLYLVHLNKVWFWKGRSLLTRWSHFFLLLLVSWLWLFALSSVSCLFRNEIGSRCQGWIRTDFWIIWIVKLKYLYRDSFLCLNNRTQNIVNGNKMSVVWYKLEGHWVYGELNSLADLVSYKVLLHLCFYKA